MYPMSQTQTPLTKTWLGPQELERVATEAAQVPLVQVPETQSRDPEEQSLPSAHKVHVPPPQSTSVSDPFLEPSLQFAGAAQKPPLQELDEQSALTRQALL